MAQPSPSGPLASPGPDRRPRGARELKARYRGSVLGWLWSLVNPLLLLGVYTAVFQFVFRRSDAATEPYALFLFTGLLPWNWFAATLLDATTCLPSNGNLIRKVLFPAEILPLTYALSQLVHFLLALPILLAGLVAAHFWLGRAIPGPSSSSRCRSPSSSSSPRGSPSSSRRWRFTSATCATSSRTF